MIKNSDLKNKTGSWANSGETPKPTWFTLHTSKKSKELAALVTCEVGVNMREYLKYSGLAESLLKKKSHQNPLLCSTKLLDCLSHIPLKTITEVYSLQRIK